MALPSGPGGRAVCSSFDGAPVESLAFISEESRRACHGVTTMTRFNRAFTLNQTINGFFESKAHNLRGSDSRLSA
jgi:hypothetical protein